MNQRQQQQQAAKQVTSWIQIEEAQGTQYFLWAKQGFVCW